jgi:hypothetical protein
VSAFDAAFGHLALDGVMAHMTEDCVFENTSPAPDGERQVGTDAVMEISRRHRHPATQRAGGTT